MMSTPDEDKRRDTISRIDKLLKGKKYPEALALGIENLKFFPEDPRLNFEVGRILQIFHKHLESEPFLIRSINTEKPKAECLNLMGICMMEQCRQQEARPYFEEAVLLEMSHPDYLMNLGVCLLCCGDLTKASQVLQHAVKLDSTNPHLLRNLAITHQQLGEVEKALALYERAHRLLPDHPETELGLGSLLLKVGNYDRGFTHYLARFKLKKFDYKFLPLPIWEGQPLTGKTIVLTAEQGFGDTIQFIRFAKPLIAEAKCVAFLCPSKLEDLFSHLDYELTLIPANASNIQAEFQTPLLSIPAFTAPQKITIPDAKGYLSLPQAPKDHFTKEALSKAHLNIGIAWAGNPANELDAQRSIHLEKLLPVINCPHARVFSLQQPQANSPFWQSHPWPKKLRDISHETQSFEILAQTMKELDLIITVDSAYAHLGGALNIETWILLPFSSDWRWGLDKSDTLWYETVRLFRQKKRGQWEEVIEEVTTALLKRCKPGPS
ncbi:MAG: tetratricopeptide repeat protein [Myxococcota bacterium]|nr:tetratricopeptide repeat protein [Myxococcota bacterium]